MCGIAGGYGLEFSAVAAAGLSLGHRGPDSSGIFSSNGISLAHRRLSIIDPTDGHQPMSDEFGNTIVFNGEIYNFLELRNDLASCGFSFKTSSDTEVLLASYRQWGPSFVRRLNGMFAFCIYDSRNNSLYLARDRFGEKPLYYASSGGKFAFASDLDALLVCGLVSPSVDVLAVQKYLAYGYFPSPLTPLKNVAKLDAGQTITFNIGAGVGTPQHYWSPILEPTGRQFAGRTQHDLVNTFGSLLLDATRLRLRSDVPVGLFLSGGLDSSAVGACIRNLEPETEVHSFSIGFDSASFDESIWASSVAQQLGFRHHSKSLAVNDLAESAISILSRVADPVADPSLLPTAILSEFAKETVSVVLTGDGGDELLAGYDTVKALKTAPIVASFPKNFQRFLSGVVGLLPASHANLPIKFKIQQFLRGFELNKNCRVPLWMSITPLREIAKLTGSPVNAEDVFSEFYHASQSDSDIADLQLYYLKSYLKDGVLAKVDRASMMYGLEARSAFLDPKLAAFCFALPDYLKYDDGITKVILRKWLQTVVPKTITKRPKKGFGIPLRLTLEHLNVSTDLKSFRCLDTSRSEVLFRSFQKGSKDVDPRLIFALMALSLSPVTGPQVC